MLTVKKLKAILAKLPDNLPILQSGDDHGYRPVQQAYETDVEITDDGMYFEYHDDENMFDGSKKIRGVVVD